MKSAKQISFNRIDSVTAKLMVVLPLLIIALTWLISTFGHKAAYFLIAGTIAVIILSATLILPVFGFYFSIAFSFFLFDILRFIRVDLPLGAFVDLHFYVVFLGLVIRKVLTREPFWKNCYHPLVFIYIVVLLYSVIQNFNPMGAPWSITLPFFKRLITFMLFFYCCIQFFETKKDIIRFLKFFFILMFIAAFYGCYQQWFGYPDYEMRYIQSNPLAEGLLSLGGGKYRKFSFLSSPTDFGILMSAGSIILLVYLINTKMNWRKRVLLLCGVAILLLSMSYSGTRTATMMFVLTVLLYVMMTLNNVKTMLFASIFAGLFVFIIYGPIHGNTTVNRLRSTFDLSADESYKVRDVNRQSVQPFIAAHPLGGGLVTSGVGSSRYVPNHPLADFPPDSGLLKNAIEYGWIGLVLLYITYIVVLQQGIHAYYRSKNPENKVLLLGAVLALFGYMVAQYAQIAIGMIPGVFLVYGLIAMIIRLRQIELNVK